MAVNKMELQCSVNGHNYEKGVCTECGQFEVQIGDFVRHKKFFKEGQIVGFDFERTFPIMVKVKQTDPKARDIIFASPDELEVI
ncbi:MAG: hypothetical protein GX177_06255 [Firmicutes bacterium]|nr:hypothetical protein [Bacillota bacterium]